MYPIDCITDKELQQMADYMEMTTKAKPADIKRYLLDWNENKTTLFKAFGKQLRVSKPFQGTMRRRDFYDKLSEVYDPMHVPYGTEEAEQLLDAAIWNYRNDFINDLYRYLLELYINEEIDRDCFCDIARMFSSSRIYEGTLSVSPRTISYKDKTMKLDYESKTIRSIQRALKMIEFPFMYEFEVWRNKISDIQTQKSFKANLVLSIHPIDYMTMSDNNCGWQSCMSWVHDGCYSRGTIEMMNSNMAVVAYLESSREYEPVEGYIVPNKSWRTLLFVHKQILLTGKNYPYQNKELNFAVLDFIRELVGKNLNWKYQYINEDYLDLINIYSAENLHYNSVHSYLRNNRGQDKHSIILSMNLMYHDMVCDHETDYWCCRNYVQRTLKLNASGKSRCVCCGGIIEGGTSNEKVCWRCEKHRCHECNHVERDQELYQIKIYYTGSNGKEHYDTRKVCKHCLLKKYSYNAELEAFSRTTDLGNLEACGNIIVSHGKFPYVSVASYFDKERISSHVRWGVSPDLSLSTYAFDDYFNRVAEDFPSLEILRVPIPLLQKVQKKEMRKFYTQVPILFKEGKVLNVYVIDDEDKEAYIRGFLKEHEEKWVSCDQIEWSELSEVVRSVLI